MLRAPAVVNIKHTWNERANELQRDPYTQAKSQLENVYNENRDQGLDTPKPTEESIQVAAKEIAKRDRKTKEDTSVKIARKNMEMGRRVS